MNNYEFDPKVLKAKLEEYREVFGEDFSLGMLIELYNADSGRTLAKNSEYTEEIKDILAAASDAIADSISALAENVPESISALTESVRDVAPEEGSSEALCVLAESLDGLAEAVSNMPVCGAADRFGCNYFNEESDPDLDDGEPKIDIKELKTERYRVFFARKFDDYNGFVVIEDKEEAKKESPNNDGLFELFYMVCLEEVRLYFSDTTPSTSNVPELKELIKMLVDKWRE